MSRFLFAFSFLLTFMACNSAWGGHTFFGDFNNNFVLDQQDIDIAVANIEGMAQEDFDRDAFVRADDLNNVWKTAFGVNANADANGDALSNGYDALAWQRQFNEIRIIRGDLNRNNIVEDGTFTVAADDLLLLQASLGQTGPHLPADLNEDGVVDSIDESIFLSNGGLVMVANSAIDVNHDLAIDQLDIDQVAAAVGLPSVTPTFYPSNDPAIADEVALSLDLVFNTPGDSSSGGTWTVVGKADLAGLAGVSLALAGVEFDTGTGFLGPASFEVQEAADFGTNLDIVLLDDMEDVVNDIGVTTTAYLDDPQLVLLPGEPDLGSFDGGVLLATGSFLPGNIPAWYDDGNTRTLSNLFTGNTATLNRHPSDYTDEVNLATTLLTVRATNIPEPGSAALLLIGAFSILSRRKRANG